MKKKRKRKALPRNYGAKKGSKRERLLRQASKLYSQGKLKEAIKIREAMEAMERGKKNYKTKKSKYSKRPVRKRKTKRKSKRK